MNEGEVSHCPPRQGPQHTHKGSMIYSLQNMGRSFVTEHRDETAD